MKPSVAMTIGIAALLLVSGFLQLFGQKPPKEPSAPLPPTEQDYRKLPRPFFRDGSAEKSISVDASVSIKLPCVSRTELRINGWNRNEVRIFVRNGSQIASRILEKSPISGKPVWISIIGVTADEPQLSECLWGEKVELDVPLNATVFFTGREVETFIDSIKKVSLDTLGGNAKLRKISSGISAVAYEGSVTVESCGGQISIETSTGNISAFDVSPVHVGDQFRGKTSKGSISLQKVDHRQVEASSVSGSVFFSSQVLNGGLYDFQTSNGTIKLVIPDSSSLRIAASYGFGSFHSAIPVQTVSENISEGGKSLIAKIGNGDATIKLTTTTGNIFVARGQVQR